jgi:signal transduction histidine kinase
MFKKKLKHALTKPQDYNFGPEDKIIPSGLIAICIIFMQYLISVEKPDGLQIIALVLFSIAIPFLTFILYFILALKEPTVPAPAYLSKSFDVVFRIGILCTGFGILFALAHSSLIVTTVFLASCFVVWLLGVFIFKDWVKAMKLERERLERELRELKLKQEKLERELELKRDITIEPR